MPISLVDVDHDSPAQDLTSGVWTNRGGPITTL